MPSPGRWPLARVLTHRCGGALAPENTLAGLEVAAALGCGGVEFDVMLSASGTPVLIHDETLERTTDGQGAVAATVDERLRALDAGSWYSPRFAGERIPFLDECAEHCQRLGLTVNLEIKPAAGHEALTGRVAALAAARLWSQAPVLPILSSFSEVALEAAAKVAPQLPRGLLVEAVPPDWQARCQRLGAVSLHARSGDFDRAAVVAARAAGLWFVTYTVNDPSLAAMLFDWGVDCVITDRPDVIHETGA